MIVELKYDKSAEGAIEQIKTKEYVDCLKDYSGEILLVGINYDKDDKRHTCQIEKNTKYNKILFKYGVNLRKINIIYFIVTRQS